MRPYSDIERAVVGMGRIKYFLYRCTPSAATLTVVGVLLLCFLFVASLVAFLGGADDLKVRAAETEQTFRTGTFFFNATHDGHRWVLYRDYDRGGMAHHPDCPCKDKP